MVALELQIGGGGGGRQPDPEIRGVRSQKIFFRPLGPQFGLKIAGGPLGPRAAPLDPALLSNSRSRLMRAEA